MLTDTDVDEFQPRATRSKDKSENKDVKKLLYKRLGKHYLADEVKKSAKDAVLTAAAYHQDTRILVVGFSNGSFFLYEMPEVNMIHSLRYLFHLIRVFILKNLTFFKRFLKESIF